MTEQDVKETLINDGELTPEGRSDTDVPPAENHGFLEQFTLFGHAAFEELKQVALEGLQSAERVMLVKTGLKLFTLGVENIEESDFTDETKHEIEELILKLESALSGK